MGGRSLSTPAVMDGIVYCASDAGVLFALDAASERPSRAASARRIVYAAGPAPAGAFNWFQNGTDAALAAQLKAHGYETMGTPALAAYMRAFDGKTARALVVLADNRIPPELVEPVDGVPLIRRFLDAGGKVVLVGANPLAYVADNTGAVVGVDFGIPSKVFGVTYAALQDAGGYYASSPTPEGRAMGLRSAFIASGAVLDAGVEVIARDEYGHANAWLRNYGGERGTGLLQLQLPRTETLDLAPFEAAMEYGITW